MNHDITQSFVLVHGSAGGGAQWKGLAALLPEGTYCACPDLVGYSFGGVVALATAMVRPELVDQLVVIEPVAFADPGDPGLGIAAADPRGLPCTDRRQQYSN